MLNQVQKSKNGQKGFTIIEVLIVLAIAGLILLIVFLAVPALQRNSRNTQRKNDVSALLAGVNDSQSNNAGVLPTAVTYAAGVYTFTNPGGVNAEAKAGYYSGGNGVAQGDVTVVPSGTVTTLVLANGAGDRVVIAPGTVCTGNTVAAGSARSVTAVYAIETGSGQYAQLCQGS